MIGGNPKPDEVLSIFAEYGSFAKGSEIDDGRSISTSVCCVSSNIL